MDNKILKNKIFLYLTEFFAGMSVMAVELGASRLLAPFFSSSQIVWTIIIGTIMIAMALGNVWGGKIADNDPNPEKLYGRIVIAAVWIGAIPFVGKYLIVGISAIVILSVNTSYLIFAALIACLIIFVFPLFLLGTVTPSLVKYTARDMGETGRAVGYLGAFNTVGSIIGTFLPTFVTIPAVGTSITFLIFAGILLIIAFIYSISEKKFRVKLPMALALFIVCCIFGHGTSFAFWQNDLTYEGESVYNYLQVREDSENVILSTNVLFGVQSIAKKDGSLSGMYYDYAMLAPVISGKAPDDCSLLVLGMGTGTYAHQCGEYLGMKNITGVEIDKKISDISKEFFFENDKYQVFEYDGRAFLNSDNNKYDVIMVDAYQDITIPFQMSSIEFFKLVKEHLADNGVMVVNLNMRGNDSEDNIASYLSDTISSVFEKTYFVNVSGGSNRVLFASDNKKFMAEGFDKFEDLDNLKLRSFIERVYFNCEEYVSKGKVLTDDKAPVELLGMNELDNMIGNEVSYYKEIFKEKGISGLIKAMS